VSRVSVSVIMPLFNKELYVLRAIDSVLTQRFRDFEVVVVNDGSTDNGPEIVGRIHDPRIRLINQANAGVSAARNRGIREARSELMAFLDADDQWMRTFLDTVLGLRADYPEAGAYATAYRIAMPTGSVRDVSAPVRSCDGPKGILRDYFRIAHHAPVWSSAVAVRRATFRQVGYFREGVALGEDADMWLRIAAYCSIAYSRDVCAVYHYGCAGSACLTLPTGGLSLMKESLSQIEADARVPGDKKEDIRRYVRRYQLATIRLYCLRGNGPYARVLLHDLGRQSLGRLRWLCVWVFLHVPSCILSLIRMCYAAIVSE
jgi:glycosyltransferase involved in cell wall biosynthesis